MPDTIPAQENIDTRRRRLLYRACHRGTKELDLILGEFAKRYVFELELEMLTRFETLLHEEEVILQHWLIGDAELPVDADRELLETIKRFQRRQAQANRGDGDGFGEGHDE